ncbi:MAG: FAD:protein FMN transferase [Candidatus Tectomicrobia bacterium]|nr:FAD:protein FMN transferase [Candidatus Tectomicrobia bacterium]
MNRPLLSRREVLKRAKAFALVIPGLSLAACGRENPADRLTEFTGATMGTTYTVQVTDLPNRVGRDALHADIHRILKTVNTRMSTYQVDSELSRFNASTSTGWFPLSTDTLEVLAEALRVSRLCGGAFDVTVGPLVNLWGFGPPMRSALPPSDGQIRDALERVGFMNIEIRTSPPAVRKHHPGMYIDLSGIAKGYGLDKVTEHLDHSNIGHYLVEIGGELRGRGHNPRGETWKIAIEKPLAGQRAIYRVAHLQNGVLATSGDYRNYFEKDGRRFAHIIHPRTGQPITHDLASVTVIGQSAMSADALATALMVLGTDAGFHLAKRENLAAFFVVKDGKRFVEMSTPAFERHLVPL